mmetsp:Transcript_9690/g.17639  ORF Transcript_9690/g.17639 Transcript_9690/m.17639 type:complete len:1161 (-) Transcript_9690:78-3560(-)|eukprot:CAMPEP_0202485062 /NCGR_PEP_ID=MMETSP1361-20130828/3988_1 /ASSEMBLY_ACC=CAM_ASM_000849 /TAXON_ID=210615 /ORGANISM="Staurosira complex sp., Strain CCMP2646" /LENGTH=1160 /DNA_ID=CAMNT_0049113863 /DNA_START=73 /DNA_END=3555 /DNA_ORIENTATION=-
MNRSRSQRPHRGRSREPSPERQEEERSQEPATDLTSTDPPSRRSTRNWRGSPTPPPAAVPSREETSTAATGGVSRAQHAKVKNAIKAKDEDIILNDLEMENSKTMGQVEQGIESARSEHLLTASTNDENNSKVPPHQALSQEVDTLKGDNGASETKAKVKHAGSKHSNGPGNDHATDGTTESGKKESSKEEDPSDEAKLPAETTGEASAPLNAEKTLTASKTDPEVMNNSPREASHQESRSISLGSKSALEVVDMEGNDHEDPMKVTTSPHVPLNDVFEKAMPFDEKVISLSSGITDKVRRARAYGEGGGEKNEPDSTNFPNAKILAKENEALRKHNSAVGLSAPDNADNADNASHSEIPLPAPGLPNEIHTDSNKPTISISAEIDNGSGILPLTEAVETGATEPTGGEPGCENDTLRTISVSKSVPREPNNANQISTDDKKHESSILRLGSSAVNPTVISDAFAIDIRPTTKSLSEARRVSRGSTASSSNLKTGRDCAVQVKGETVLSDSRKRSLTKNYMGRREEIAGILSSSVVQHSMRHVKARRSRRMRPRQSQGDRLSGLTYVENVKLQLYHIACRVHRSKGPERRFAAYWEALRQYLRFQVHQGPSTISSSVNGVHDELNSFLVTKQMRKLHNILVMGLLSRCVKDSVEEAGIREAVPGEWHARVPNRNDDLPVTEDLDVSLDRTSMTAFDLGDFGFQSDLWTAAGREPLSAHSSGVIETDDSRISDKEVSQLHRHEPRLPGALAIDPLVRGIVRDESSLKVSENAIWLLIVATRQYTETVVKNTVSNLESIRCEHSLEPVDFATCDARSRNMRTPKSATKSGEVKNDSGTGQTSANAKKPPITPEKKAPAGNKRRRVTPLDIAAALDGSHLSQGGRSLAGSVPSIASVRCFQSSFHSLQTTIPPSLDSVQSFIMERVESVAKRPRHEWRDPEAVHVALVAPERRQQSPQKKSIDAGSSTRTYTAPRQEPRKDVEFQAASAQEGGTPKATTAARPGAGVAGDEARPGTTMTVPSPRVSNMPLATGLPRPGNASMSPPPPPAGVIGSPSSVSPRGKGRGFGVKDLAAMRARSGSTPPKQVNTSPALGRESNPSNGAMQQTTPTMQQQNGAGKELRRLQQVQGQKNDSPATASENAMPGMIPAVPVAGQHESMDTTQ